MAASQASTVLVTGCGGRDNIGRGERVLKVASPKDTRRLLGRHFFTGSADVSTNASNARDPSDRQQVPGGTWAVRTSQNVSPFSIAFLQKRIVVKKNEGVNLMEYRDVLCATGTWFGRKHHAVCRSVQ